MMRRWALRRTVVIGVLGVVCLIVSYHLLHDASQQQHLDLTQIRDHETDTGLLSSRPDCVLICGKCFTYRKKTGRTSGLDSTGPEFKLNGKLFRIVSGSFHYFRTHPLQWADRLRRMKVVGLNTVTTYVPWNLHERIRGNITLERGSTIWDLVTFIEMVHTFDMYLIIRPGPYICAEWDLGGFPSWLLHDPNMILRSSKYEPFLEHVEKFFDQLLPILARYTYIQGGPIIAVQIENEFGSYGHDPDYLNSIAESLRKHKVDAMMFTSDGAKHLQNGSLPGILATANFKRNASLALNTLRDFQPGRPLMVTEFWSGWFDHWGESHHVMSATEFTESVDLILSMNASINFYMFVGGTNFAFFNGANDFVSYNTGYAATVTSYDYDALVTESGDCHATKYDALQALLVKHGVIQSDFIMSVPLDPVHVEYSPATLESYIAMNDLVKLFLQKSITLPETIHMEFLNSNNNGGQSFGWLLYSTTFDKFSSSSTLKIVGTLQNRGLVYVNGQFVAEIYDKNSSGVSSTVSLSKVSRNSDGFNTIELLVENMGRVNYMRLNDQRRGFHGEVSVDGTVIHGWTHVSFEFNDEFIASISKSREWRPFVFGNTTLRNYPAVYRAYFEVFLDVPLDTYIDMFGWSKGIVIINQFNLGRYWRVGPQRTLYVPAPLLKKGKNEVIIFDLDRGLRMVRFTSGPMLDHKW